jgi:hypothetical protein
MESPSSWGSAEKVVRRTIQEHYELMSRHVIGLSLERRITDALRAEGLLKEDGNDS